MNRHRSSIMRGRTPDVGTQRTGPGQAPPFAQDANGVVGTVISKDRTGLGGILDKIANVFSNPNSPTEIAAEDEKAARQEGVNFNVQHSTPAMSFVGSFSGGAFSATDRQAVEAIREMPIAEEMAEAE